MLEGMPLYVVGGTALASGLVGGVFYAFSTFVMAGLERLPPAEGIAAMQSINVTALRPGLMIPFFGTLIAAVAVGVVGVVNWGDPASPWMLAGAVSYAIGTFAMTVGYHVPRNNLLAATAAMSLEAPAVWDRYRAQWTRWNHLRTASSMATAATLTVALVAG